MGTLGNSQLVFHLIDWQWAYYYPGNIPYFFQWCRVTHDLFNFVIELHPLSTSMGLAKNIKCMKYAYLCIIIPRDPTELHLLEYKQGFLEYLQSFQQCHISPFETMPLLEFSSPYDTEGYAYDSITDDLITDLFLEFSEWTQKDESNEYMQTFTGKSTSFITGINADFSKPSVYRLTIHSKQLQKQLLSTGKKCGQSL